MEETTPDKKTGVRSRLVNGDAIRQADSSLGRTGTAGKHRTRVAEGHELWKESVGDGKRIQGDRKNWT